MAIKITDSVSRTQAFTSANPGYAPSNEFGQKAANADFRLNDVADVSGAMMDVAKQEFDSAQGLANALGQAGNMAQDYAGKLKVAEETERAESRLYEHSEYMRTKEQELLKEKNEWDHSVEWYETEMKSASSAYFEKVQADASFTTPQAQQHFNNRRRQYEGGVGEYISKQTNQMRQESFTAAKQKNVSLYADSAAASGDFNTVIQAQQNIRSLLTDLQRTNPVYSDEQLEADVLAETQKMWGGYLNTEALKHETVRTANGIYTGADDALDIVATNRDQFVSVYGEMGVLDLEQKLKDMSEKQGNDFRSKERAVEYEAERVQKARAHTWQIAISDPTAKVGFEATETQLLEDLKAKRISDSDYRTLSNKFETENKERTEVHDFLNQVVNTSLTADPKNTKEVKAINTYYTKTFVPSLKNDLKDVPPEEMPRIMQERVATFIKDTGIIPDEIKNGIDRGLRSNDPTVAAEAANSAYRLSQLGVNIEDQLGNDAVDASLLMKKGMPSIDAFALVKQNRDSESFREYKSEYKKDFEKNNKSRRDNDMNFLSQQAGWDLESADPFTRKAIEKDFGELNAEHYARLGGDVEGARDRTTSVMKRQYGMFNGKLVKNPPSVSLKDQPQEVVEMHFKMSVESVGLDPDDVYVVPASNHSTSSKRPYMVMNKQTHEPMYQWVYDPHEFKETDDAWTRGVSNYKVQERQMKERVKLQKELLGMKKMLANNEAKYKDVGTQRAEQDTLKLSIDTLKQKIDQYEGWLGDI